MGKKLIIAVGLLFSILFLVACGEKTYKLTLPGEVTADVTNLEKIKKNTSVTLTIAIPSGKEIETFKLNNDSIAISGNTHTFKMTKNVVVSVTFKDVHIEEVYYVLTLPESVTGSPVNPNQVLKGSSVTLTVNIPEGNEIDEFKLNGNVVVISGNTHTFVMNGDTTVSVTFKEIPVAPVYYVLTLPASVMGSPGNPNRVLKGSNVTLTVIIPEDKLIDEFKLNGVNVVIIGNTHTFVMNEDTVVTVTFKDIPAEANYYSLILPASITSNLDDNQNVLEDTLVTLTINIPEGKEIDLFKVNGEEKVIALNTYTLIIIANTTVTITYKDIKAEPVYYSLTLPASITSNQNDNASILEDTIVTLTIEIPEGKVIDEFKVNGDIKVVSGNTYNLTITEDMVVTVSFKEAPVVKQIFGILLPDSVTADVDNTMNILEDTIVTLTIHIPPGKLIDEFKFNGISIILEGNTTYTFTIITDVFITVTFVDIPAEPVYYSLTLPDSITTTHPNLNSILENSEVILLVEIPGGFEVDEFKVNGEVKQVVGNNYIFHINEDTVVTITFKAIPTFTLTLPPEVTVDVSDPLSILRGTEVELTVHIPEGKKIDNFKINDNFAFIEGNTHTIIVNSDIVVTVTFLDIEEGTQYYSLTLPAEVTADVPDLNNIAKFTDFNLTIALPEGMMVDEFRVNGVLKEVYSNTYMLIMYEDTIITVTFKERPIYYTLSMHPTITANVDNINEVVEGSEVILTINIPQDMEIDWLKINGVEKEVVGNTYTFIMTENVVVTIMYANAWVVAQPLYVQNKINNLDISLFRQGQINVNIKKVGIYTTIETNASFKLDNKLNLIEGYLVTRTYVNEELQSEDLIYLYNSYYRMVNVTYTGGVVDEISDYYEYRDFSAQALELFGVFFVNNPLMPTGPLSANDLLVSLLEKRGDRLINKEAFNDVEFYFKDDLFKIAIEGGNLDIFNMFFNNKNITSTLDLIVKSDKIHEAFINLNDQVFIDINYEVIPYEVSDLIDTDYFDVDEVYVYYFHYPGGSVQAGLSNNYAQHLPDIDDFQLYKLVRIFNKGMSVKGLYKDQAYTIKVHGSDFSQNGLNVYVKFVEIEDLDDILESFITNDVIYLEGVDGSIYFEDDDYIYMEEDASIKIVDKATMDYYNVNIVNETTFNTTLMPTKANGVTLRDKLLTISSDDFIEIKALYTLIDGGLMILDNFINVEYGYLGILENLYFNKEGIFDKSIIDTYLAEPEEITVLVIFQDSFGIYVDVNNLLNELRYTVYFSDGQIVSLTLGQMVDIEIATYIFEDDELTLYYNEQSLKLFDVTFYDSSRGRPFILDDKDMYYFEELSDISIVEGGKYNTFSHYLAKDGTEIYTLQELSNYINSKLQIVRLETIFDLADLEDIADELKDEVSLKFTDGIFTYYFYDHKYTIMSDSGTLFINFEEDNINISNNRVYYEFDKQTFNPQVFYNNMFFNFYDFIMNSYTAYYFIMLLEDFLTGSYGYTQDGDSYLINNALFVNFDGDDILFSFNGYDFELEVLDEPAPSGKTDGFMGTFTIRNDFTKPTIIKTDEYNILISFNYSHEGYLSEGYFKVNEQYEPIFDEPFYFYNFDGSVMDVYEKIEVILSATELLEPLTSNEVFSLIGSAYTIRVDKNSYVEIHNNYTEKLEFYIDLVSGTSYYYIDGVMYEFFDQDLIFNIVDFLENFTEQWYIFDGFSNYYLDGTHYPELYFELFARGEFRIGYKLLAMNYYEFSDEVFIPYDVSGVVYTEEVITKITVTSHMGSLISEDSLHVLEFNLLYSSKYTVIRDYYMLDQQSLVSYNDGIITLHFFEDILIDLSDHNISIYDPSFGQVVIFEDINEFSYIQDLIEFPVLPDDGLYEFIGWNIFGELVTLQELKDDYDYLDIVYLWPAYEVIKLQSLYQLIETNNAVDLYFTYYDEDTWDYEASQGIYLYEDDAFFYRNLFYEAVFFVFEDDLVMIIYNDIIISYNYDDYDLKLLDNILHIFKFEQTFKELLLLRSFLRGEFEGESLDGANYLFDEFELIIDSYNEILTLVVGNNTVSIYLQSETFEVTTLDYNLELTLLSDHSNDEIVIYTNNHLLIDELVFIVEDYEIEGIYNVDEYDLPLLDSPLVLTELDVEVRASIIYIEA